MNFHPECATENIEGQEQEDTSMSSKTNGKKIRSSKRAERTARAGEPRKCSKCGGLGHNARSHLPGGLLA